MKTNKASRIQSLLSLKAIYDYYEMEMPQNAIEEAFQSIVSDGLLDFGRLNEDFQKEILLNLRKSPEQRSSVDEFPLKYHLR